MRVAADGLPAAGSAVNSVVESAMPSVMSGAHASADAARAMAVKMASSGALPANAQQLLPGVLNGAASGLDMFVDGAPAVKQAVTYVADKAVPVVQAALRVSSQVSADAAGMPLPNEAQVTTSLRAVGVNPQQLTAQAGDLARQATASVATAAEQLPANAAKVVEKLPLPKRKAPPAAVRKPIPAEVAAA